MPKASTKTLRFPLGGVARHRGYRDQTKPYSCPHAVNVRGVGPLERRERGGSRPGLVKVVDQDLGGPVTGLFYMSWVDTENDGQHRRDLTAVANGKMWCLRGDVATKMDGVLVDENDEPILTADGEEIILTEAIPLYTIGDGSGYSAAVCYGKLYVASTNVLEYNPTTGIVSQLTASAGVLPTDCPLMCVYRDRLVLAGDDHMWYASRMGDVTDWDFGADVEDTARAVAGQVARAGLVGEKIRALIPLRDDALIMATRNSLWVMRGDPATGSLHEISAEIGILSHSAWAMDQNGLIAFLSYDGVYMWDGSARTRPKPLSRYRVPDSLRAIDADTSTITMCYDASGRGYHLFVVPTDGLGSNWWLDVENKAMWPVVVPEDMQPLAMTRFDSNQDGLSEPVLGCQDGYLRKFSASAMSDDGENMESHVLLGPVHLTNNDTLDAMLTELHGVIADGDATVTWRVVSGDSAEAVADDAAEAIEAYLETGEESTSKASGTWGSGRNPDCPTSRAWAVGVYLAVVHVVMGLRSRSDQGKNTRSDSVMGITIDSLTADAELTGVEAFPATDGGVAKKVTTEQIKDFVLAALAGVDLASEFDDDDYVLVPVGDSFERVSVAAFVSHIESQVSSISPVVAITAPAAISAHRAVAEDGNHYSPSSATTPPVGITQAAKSAGESLAVQTSGPMTNTGWSWTAGGLIYAGASGVLTQTAPSSGLAVPVAKAVTATQIVVRIGQPVRRA